MKYRINLGVAIFWMNLKIVLSFSSKDNPYLDNRSYTVLLQCATSPIRYFYYTFGPGLLTNQTRRVNRRFRGKRKF